MLCIADDADIINLYEEFSMYINFYQHFTCVHYSYMKIYI